MKTVTHSRYINPASAPAAMSHRLREIDRHLLQCQTELARLAPLQSWDRERLTAVRHAESLLRSMLANDGVPVESVFENKAENKTVFPNRTNTRFVNLYSMEDRQNPGMYEFYSGNSNRFMQGWVNVQSGRIKDTEDADAFARNAFDWLSEEQLAFKQTLIESAVAQFREWLIKNGIPTDTITETPNHITFTNKDATRVIRLNTAQALHEPCQYGLYDGDPKQSYYTWKRDPIYHGLLQIKSEEGVKHFVYMAYVWLIDPTHTG